MRLAQELDQSRCAAYPLTISHTSSTAVLTSTLPPVAATEFFVERDSAAFRALVAKVMNLGALEIEDGWVEDGDVQVFKFVTKPVCPNPNHLYLQLIWTLTSSLTLAPTMTQTLPTRPESWAEHHTGETLVCGHMSLLVVLRDLCIVVCFRRATPQMLAIALETPKRWPS